MESRRQCKTIRFIGANEVVIVPIRLNYCGGSAVAMDVEKFSVSTKLSKVLVGPISISMQEYVLTYVLAQFYAYQAKGHCYGTESIEMNWLKIENMRHSS